MSSPLNPPNTVTNQRNVYSSYAAAIQSALAVSRTNPSITYYLQDRPAVGDTYAGCITTVPDETSAHAFVAGEMITL